MQHTTPTPETYLETGARIRGKLEQEYKTDMVGLLEELPYILNVRTSRHSGERRKSYERMENLLEESGLAYYKPVLQEANRYADTAEREGFRRGFHVAMQICMDGMRGGVLL